MKNKKIKPELPSGFIDFIGQEAKEREAFIEKITALWRSFGFVYQDTSPVEKLSVLLGNEENEINKEIYTVSNIHSTKNKDIGLRFDLTVPLARTIAANYTKFIFPYKRYQYGYVWRGERAQKGRYRQFMQFDADIIGTKNPASDAEIIFLMKNTLLLLGLRQFKIRISSRAILNDFFSSKTESSLKDIYRIIDKLDKIGIEKIEEELKKKSLLSSEEILKLRKLLSTKGPINEFNSIIAKTGLKNGQNLQDLKNIIDILLFEKESSFYEIDFSIIRGLDYYTGMVFETTLEQAKEFGSILSGGRYDNLLNKFSIYNIPAVGASIGIDRLLSALKDKNIRLRKTDNKNILITVTNKNDYSNAFGISQKIRNTGFNCEIYFGKKLTIKDAINYAIKKEISIIIIAGEKELQNGYLSIKDLTTRKQERVSLDSLMEYLKNLSG